MNGIDASRNKWRRYKFGFQSFFDAFRFISDNKLWRYACIPTFISIVVMIGIISTVTCFLGINIETWLEMLPDLQTPDYGEGILWAILEGITLVFVQLARIAIYIFDALAFVFAFIVGMVLIFFTFRLIANIIIIPFMGPLLSKSEKILIGSEIDITLMKDIKNGLLGIVVTLKSFAIEIFFFFAFFTLGPLQPFLMAFVTSYFLGRGSMEYILEKHSLTLKERKERVKPYKWEIAGLGMAQFLVTLTGIGIFVAPACAIVGAARIFYDENSVSRL